MSTLETQYKNWILKNPNSQFTYVKWLEKFNEIHNLPTDMSVWDVTLMDGLENEPYISDDFQIGPDGAYEHTDDMTPERALKYAIGNAEGYKRHATNENELCEHDIISAYNNGYTQCQQDMTKDVEYWQSEADHWYQQAIDMADKKYTEEDIENAFNSGREYGVSDNTKDFNSFINSLNKQD